MDSPNVSIHYQQLGFRRPSPASCHEPERQHYLLRDGEFAVFNVTGRGTVFVVDAAWYNDRDAHPEPNLEDVIIVIDGAYAGVYEVRGIETGGSNKQVGIVVRRVPIGIADSIKTVREASATSQQIADE